MEWTGSLYFFYSNKSQEKVFNELKNYTKKLNYNFSFSKNENTIFFYKNKKMLKKHLNKGYHLNKKGKGCFAVESKIVDENSLASLSDNNQTFDIYLTFKSINYYVLILPSDVEDSDFSKKIFDIFRKILVS